MHALAGQRVQVRGERGDEGLALTGLHLGDTALMQYDTADELHVEMAHAHRTGSRLTHHGEGFRQQVIEGLPLLEAGAEFRGLAPEFLIRKGFYFRLQRIDLFDHRLQLFELAFAGIAQQFIEKSHIESTYLPKLIYPVILSCRGGN